MNIDGSKVQDTFHRLINYLATQFPFNLKGHFVKRSGLGDTFGTVYFICSMVTCTLTCGK